MSIMASKIKLVIPINKQTKLVSSVTEQRLCQT